MKDPRDIIISPIVSEKSYAAAQNKQYSFFIDPGLIKVRLKKLLRRFLM